MKVSELIQKLHEFSPDLEVFFHNRDEDWVADFSTFDVAIYKLYRKDSDVGFEEDRKVGNMNTYALEYYKDAEVFDALVIW